jgi:glycosyltransferase involved in cell wall biosynthesis
LYEAVPPKLYGGTERVVSWLSEELVRQGHHVTLFASGDSRTQAELVPICPQALRLDPQCRDPIAWHILQIQTVLDRANESDIVHFNTDYLHFPSAALLPVPHVTTLHGRLDLPELQPLYRRFRDIPVISISNAQRIPLPMARWVGTVYHGLPEDLYRMGSGSGAYLAFLGRVSPEKGVDRAIEIAKRAGISLKIAAKVDKADIEYFETEIKHLLDHPLIEFLGEINDAQKQGFLSDAMGLLFPVDWPEPFGIAMIEAMACGTPMIAFCRGSVPEVIDEGETGYVVDSVEAAVAAVQKLHRFSREHCRATFEERFSARRMARDYLALYAEFAATTTVRPAKTATQRAPAGLVATPVSARQPSSTVHAPVESE